MSGIDLRKSMGPVVFAVLARRLGLFPHGTRRPIHGAGAAVGRHVGATDRNFGPSMWAGQASAGRLAEICHDYQIPLVLYGGEFSLHPGAEYEVVDDATGTHIQYLDSDPGLECGSPYGETWRFVHHTLPPIR